MLRKAVLPLLAVAGLTFALIRVRSGGESTPVSQPLVQPTAPPYQDFVAAAGIVEAATENIAIGTPLSGLVTRVFVHAGSKVRKGEPLFQLDDRALRSDYAVRVAELDTARRNTDRLRSLPRKEDLPPLEAQVRDAEAAVADEQRQLESRLAVTDKRAVSREEVEHRRSSLDRAKAQLDRVRAQLSQTRAGAWQPDLEQAFAEIRQAEARVDSAQVDIERATIRAPADGECLQVKIHAGEFAQAGQLQTPLILLGRTSPLAMRVDINEYDLWRVNSGAAATAYPRGLKTKGVPLRFVRFEPYVIPKQSLTGDARERVDTRVLQAIYEFDPGELRVFVGQQMDVYIQSSGRKEN